MKLLAIVHSTHMGNTMQIAEAMAEVAPLTIAELGDAGKYDLSQFDAVGFGGGINAGSHDKKLMQYVQKLNAAPALSFVFSTSASGKGRKQNAKLIKLLEEKHDYSIQLQIANFKLCNRRGCLDREPQTGF